MVLGGGNAKQACEKKKVDFNEEYMRKKMELQS